MDIYQREFLALRERLHLAEQENLRRSKELNLVLEEIKKAIAEKQALRDINRTWSSLSGRCRSRRFHLLPYSVPEPAGGRSPLTFIHVLLPEETRLRLWNVSSSKNVLQLPSIFHHLPHLLNRDDSLLPAVHVGQGRTGGEGAGAPACGGAAAEQPGSQLAGGRRSPLTPPACSFHSDGGPQREEGGPLLPDRHAQLAHVGAQRRREGGLCHRGPRRRGQWPRVCSRVSSQAF